MVLPLIRRVRIRRRRILFALALFMLTALYLGYTHEHDGQAPDYVPSLSPEDRQHEHVTSLEENWPEETAGSNEMDDGEGYEDGGDEGDEGDEEGEDDRDGEEEDEDGEDEEDGEDGDGDENREDGGDVRDEGDNRDEEDEEDDYDDDDDDDDDDEDALEPDISMEYGTSARPPIAGLPQRVVAELPVELLLPQDAESDDTKPGVLRRRRIVFVGDVHGQRSALEALLDTISFAAGRDHLVLTGDLVSKGPDSAGVVDLAMQLGASAVRGNHEDRVLLAYGQTGDADDEDGRRRQTQLDIEIEGRRERAAAKLELEEEEAAYREELEQQQGSSSFLAWLGWRDGPEPVEDPIDHDQIYADLHIDPLEQNPFSHGDAPERAIAASLTPDQHRWLADLPVILHLGRIGPSSSSSSSSSSFPFDDVVVVHAGLAPDVPLARQDPCAAMTMRSLVHPADEVRRDQARALVIQRMRALAGGTRPRTPDGDLLEPPPRQVDAVFCRLQRNAYGPDPLHPRPPVLVDVQVGGVPVSPVLFGQYAEADMALLPIEAHFGQAHDRLHWAAGWNQAQHRQPDPANRTTVVYGHDAVTGLSVPPTTTASFRKSAAAWLAWLWGAGRSPHADADADAGYTFGLDSGCVYGGKLTALVVQADARGSVVHSIAQVPCPTAAVRGS